MFAAFGYFFLLYFANRDVLHESKMKGVQRKKEFEIDSNMVFEQIFSFL
jgi:hypothetical protein